MAYPIVPYTPYTATLRNRRPLVKRRAERDYAPIIIDSRRGGPLKVTERHLDRYMPSARNILRQTGNRRLTRQACFSGRFDSREDEAAAQDVYEWLTSRLIDPRYPSRTILTMSGPITEDIFEQMYEDLYDALLIGDRTEIEGIADQALRFFQQLSEHLGRRGTLNPSLLHEILHNAKKITTLFQHDAFIMYDLLRSMFRMTDSPVVLQTLMEGMAFDAQEELYYEVVDRNDFESSDLNDEILYYLGRMHRMSGSAMIQNLSRPRSR